MTLFCNLFIERPWYKVDLHEKYIYERLRLSYPIKLNYAKSKVLNYCIYSCM